MLMSRGSRIGGFIRVRPFSSDIKPRTFEWVPPNNTLFPHQEEKEVVVKPIKTSVVIAPVQAPLTSRRQRSSLWNEEAEKYLDRGTFALKVIPYTPLTLPELHVVLEMNGALNTVSIPASNCKDPTMSVVIATGASSRNISKLGNVIFDAIKARGLKRHFVTKSDLNPSLSGGWMLLDLGHIVVHLFDEKNRKLFDFDSKYIKGQEDPLSLELEKDTPGMVLSKKKKK